MHSISANPALFLRKVGGGGGGVPGAWVGFLIMLIHIGDFIICIEIPCSYRNPLILPLENHKC